MKPITVGTILSDAGSVVMSAWLEAAWKTWASRFQEAPAPPGMPGPLRGFVLGSTDLAATPNHVLVSSQEDLEAQLPKRLAVVHVEFIQVEYRSEPWWHDVQWTIPWSRRVKFRG
jgi:hypothetical protein